MTLTLIMAVAWLALLAAVMTTALERIGCALKIPSTVMGLTLGAIGTSFPNLYASILTAQAEQAGMSICQAFGSNTFNLCIGLGLVWFFEALVGECLFGAILGQQQHASCEGCYMPGGFAHACPRVLGTVEPPQSGSLDGTAIVVFVNIRLLIVTFATRDCRIPKAAAYGYFVVYGLYVVYEVAGAYGFRPFALAAASCLSQRGMSVAFGLRSRFQKSGYKRPSFCVSARSSDLGRCC